MELNPLAQFQVKSFGNFSVANIDLAFTNSAFFMCVSVICIIIFFYISFKKSAVIPYKMQILAELSYEFVGNLAKDNIGNEKAKQFFPLIYSIFLFILFSNLVGNLPFTFSITGQTVVTLTISMFIFCLATIYGLFRHGLRFFKIFYPEGIPLILAPLIVPAEIISYFAKAVSMGIRLFANVMAGHLMLSIFAGFVFSLGIFGILPLLLTTALIGFELFVAFLQAYIFTVLSCIFIGDVVNLH